MVKVKIADFRKAYEEAVKNKQKEFRFKDMNFVIGYAKYLLQYLTESLKRNEEDIVNLSIDKK